MVVLTKNLVRQKKGSHCSFQDFHSLAEEGQVSLLRIFLPRPDSDGNQQTGGLGVGNGPDALEPLSVQAEYMAGQHDIK